MLNKDGIEMEVKGIEPLSEDLQRRNLHAYSLRYFLIRCGIGNDKSRNEPAR